MLDGVGRIADGGASVHAEIGCGGGGTGQHANGQNGDDDNVGVLVLGKVVLGKEYGDEK